MRDVITETRERSISADYGGVSGAQADSNSQAIASFGKT
jgi:hypothetical protein